MPVPRRCRRRVLSDGSLSVGPVDDNAYEGNYTCRVENIFGRDHISYTINVLYPPAAPDFQVDAVSTGALLVQWKPVKQPDAVTTAYVIVYRTGDEQPQRVDVDSDRFTYTVDRLKCGSKYAVIMRTVNTVGTSGDSPVKEVYTKGGGKPTHPEPPSAKFTKRIIFHRDYKKKKNKQRIRYACTERLTLSGEALKYIIKTDGITRAKSIKTASLYVTAIIIIIR